MAEQLSIGPDRPIAGNFVVLHALSAGDHACVKHLGLGIFFKQLFVFGDDPLHGFAGLFVGIDIEFIEDLLQSLDMSLGLLQVLLEGALQLGRSRLFGHFGQGLQDHVLCRIKVLEFFYEKFMQ